MDGRHVRGRGPDPVGPRIAFLRQGLTRLGRPNLLGLKIGVLRRVTAVARTRVLRSHNPMSSVSGCCRTLQNWLR
jgi:hypothetical protein